LLGAYSVALPMHRRTHVGYLDPRELADRYALDGHQQTLERQSAVLTKLAAAAAG
jgi:hypothetical protein